MNNLPTDLQDRLSQLKNCIKSQQTHSALLALEDLTKVLKSDYQEIQKAYLTLQQLHISARKRKVDLPPFLKDNCEQNQVKQTTKNNG